MLDKIVPALIGAAAGILAFLFVGWTEGQRQFQIRKAEAYFSFVRDNWASVEDPEGTASLKALSAITVYADPDVIKAYSRYVRADCAAKMDPPDCRRKWAAVVNAMRESLNQERTPAAWIIGVVWGS